METPTAPESLTDFSNDEEINSDIKEKLFEIDEKLNKAYWRIIDTSLTKRQKEIIKYSAGGLTQMETAKKLNVNQSSITKSIHGNCDYKNGRKIYGGSEKKLKKAAEKDPEIQELRKHRRELLDNY